MVNPYIFISAEDYQRLKIGIILKCLENKKHTKEIKESGKDLSTELIKEIKKYEDFLQNQKKN